MWIILRLKRIFAYYFFDLNGLIIWLLMIGYIISNWVLLFLCQEQQLLSTNNFIYWLIISASTVGYGDLSPVTTAGKYVVVFFTIPFGLGLFALVMGRIAAYTANQWKRGVKGLKQLNLQNHIVVLGWNQKRTPHLLNLLVAETQQNQRKKIVLCTTEDIDNPLPEFIHFVKVSHFNHLAEMQHACIDQASSIIIDTKLDDVTLTTALFCSSINPDAHLIVYFTDESLSTLLKKHCPHAECTPSLSVEILVKAAMDPGSSNLHHELLRADKGVTQFSVLYPSGQNTMLMKTLFNGFKQHYDATIIAIMNNNSTDIILNPHLNMSIDAGTTIYYIAKKRILNIHWQILNV